MNPQQIQNKLEIMKGNSYDYAKTLHTVTSYKISTVEEEFTIITDKNRYCRKFTSAEEFFKYWNAPAEKKTTDFTNKKEDMNADLIKDDTLIVLLNKENEIADDLISILKNSIQKVQKDPAYINQAKAINNDVNSIINIAKLKLELAKQYKGRK